MIKPQKTSHSLWPTVFVFLGLLDLGILLALLLRGTDIELLHPKGLIAQQEFRLIVLSALILLGVAVPSVLLFYYFAWKYRETNDQATYDPSTKHGKLFVGTIWGIPSLVMVAMACIMWTSTHRLDPHTPLNSTTKPLIVQVIALRWKWLFIYPEQHIASVNYVQIPTDRPIRFDLTADEVPMSSFWIPHLSGQLYAMTGHVNSLNLMASNTGTYQGSSAEINGAGFAGMKFTAVATTQMAFDEWAQSIGQSANVLDAYAYTQLVKPSENNAPQNYASPAHGLYDTVVMKYMKSPNDMAGME